MRARFGEMWSEGKGSFEFPSRCLFSAKIAGMSPVLVALIGVGGVGAAVVQQLLGPLLVKSFKIISVSNSKYTLSLSPASPALSAAKILALLPPSSTASLPERSTQEEGISVSLANSTDLIQQLAKTAKDTGSKVLFIDCTSDLSITELYPSAVAAGISVITPNKKGFSSSATLWHDILAAQKVKDSGLVYMEATVGAGLPIISTLKDLINTGDQVTKIEGVLSGTLSYIFNEFSKAGTPVQGEKKVKFSEVVRIAKENGYTVRRRLDVSATRHTDTHADAGTSPSGRSLRLGRRTKAHHSLPSHLPLPLYDPPAAPHAR